MERAKSSKQSLNQIGLVYAFLSVIGASGMAVAIRGASDTMPSTAIAGYRAGLMCLVILVALLGVPSIRAQLRFSNPRLHILRGVLFGISVQLGFFTITQIPLAMATVLFFTAPIFAAILSVLLRGETIGPRRIFAIILGFAGALIIIRPGIVPVNLGMLTAIGSSVIFAIGLLLSRNLAQEDGAVSTLASSTAITFLISLPLMWGQWAVPTGQGTWVWLIALVGFSILRQICDIQAYRVAEASVIAPVAYLRLVFVAIVAYFLFSEVPDLYTWIGAAVIVGSALFIGYREAQLRRISEPSTPLK